MPNTVKRETLEMVVVVIAFIIAFIFMIFVFPKEYGKVYDCGMAEWHPDVPTKVKEECRRLRAKNFQEELKKPK